MSGLDRFGRIKLAPDPVFSQVSVAQPARGRSYAAGFFADANAQAFRAGGGIVVAHYYGNWDRQSVDYNASPWRSLRNYPERIPYRARTYVDIPLYEFDRFPNGFNCTGSTITPGAGLITLTSTGSDPVLMSPILPYIDGANWTTVEIDVKRIGGAGWDGSLFFMTHEDPVFEGVNKRVSIAQPTWDGSVKTISVSLSGNTHWTGGTIRQIRFDLGSSSADVFEISRVEIKGNKKGLRNLEVRGLFSEDQYAAECEVREAYRAGIDVFMHCFYWNRLNGSANRLNLAQASLDRHASITSATTPMKYCLHWTDLGDTFAAPNNTIAELNTLFDAIIAHFSNSRYWFIDGRPVVGIFSVTRAGLIGQGLLGAADANKNGVKAFCDAFKARYGNDIHIVFHINDSPYWASNSLGWVGGLDYAGARGCYSYHMSSALSTITPTAGGGTEGAAYPAVAEQTTYGSYREVCALWARNLTGRVQPNGAYLTNSLAKPWYPVIASRDENAWIDRDSGAYGVNGKNYSMPSKAEVKAFMLDAREAILTNSKLAPVVSIYAWNEYGEGGILAPCPANRGEYLEAISEVFGGRS